MISCLGQTVAPSLHVAMETSLYRTIGLSKFHLSDSLNILHMLHAVQTASQQLDDQLLES